MRRFGLCLITALIKNITQATSDSLYCSAIVSFGFSELSILIGFLNLGTKLPIIGTCVRAGVTTTGITGQYSHWVIPMEDSRCIEKKERRH